MPHGDDAQPLGRRRAPASLPCCVRPLLQFLFFDMLAFDDGFVDTIRKGGTLVGLVIGVMVPFGIFTGSDPATLFASTSSAIYVACGLSTALAWIATYIVTRLNAVPVANALAAMCAFNLVSIAIGIPCTADFPLHLSLIQLPIAVAIFNLPLRWLWFAGAGLPYAFACYNWAAKTNANPDFTPLFLDDGPAAAAPAIDSRMSAHMAQFAFAVVFALTVYAMHDEYAHQISRSQASATVGALVAQKLAVYNTEDARAILAVAAAAPSSVVSNHDDATGAAAVEADQDEEEDLVAVRGSDPALVESLLAIVANLEAYRPHLPNWMVDAVQNVNAADDATGSSVMERTAGSSFRGHADTASNSSRRSVASRASARYVGADAATASAAVVASHAPTDTVRTVLLARARLVFQAHAALSDNRSAAASAAACFVDTVYAAARATKAAVHSFVGDTVEVSWNAAASVAAPGAKAARFLAAVNAACALAAGDASRHAVGGGAVLCKGRIQMAGTGVQQALLLNVDALHVRALDVLSRAGGRHGCMFATKAVAEEGLDVVSCAVARYRRPPPRDDDDDDKTDEGARTAAAVFAPAFAMLRQRAASEEADEWLYVINRPEALPPQPSTGGSNNDDAETSDDASPFHVTASHAFHAAVDGNFKRAADKLRGGSLTQSAEGQETRLAAWMMAVVQQHTVPTFE